MTNFDRTAERSTDPRPAYIPLGTDGEGAHHIYQTRRERVVVVAEGRRQHVQRLNSRSVHEWMAYVADRRGWGRKRMHRSASAAVASGVAA